MCRRSAVLSFRVLKCKSFSALDSILMFAAESLCGFPLGCLRLGRQDVILAKWSRREQLKKLDVGRSDEQSADWPEGANAPLSPESHFNLTSLFLSRKPAEQFHHLHQTTTALRLTPRRESDESRLRRQRTRTTPAIFPLLCIASAHLRTAPPVGIVVGCNSRRSSQGQCEVRWVPSLFTLVSSKVRSLVT